MHRQQKTVWAVWTASACLLACGPSEKTAPLPPTDLIKRAEVLAEIKKELAVLEKADAEDAAALVTHPDHRVRRAAVKKLSTFKDSPDLILERLAVAARDENREVRIAALIGLSGIDSDRSVDPVIRALADSDSKVRMWAYKGLKKLEKRAVPVMIQHIVKKTSIAALKYQKDASSNATESLSDLLLLALSEMGKPAVPYLVDILKESTSTLSAEAVNVLGKIGPAASDSIPVLLRLLDSTSDTTLKKNAIDAIAKIGDMDPEVMPKLLELSEDSDDTIAGAAKQAVNKLEEDS